MPNFPVNGDNVTFNCTVVLSSDVPETRITWFHHGYIMRPMNRVKIDHWHYQDLTYNYYYGSELQINPTKWTDSGKKLEIYMDDSACYAVIAVKKVIQE